MLRSTKVTAQIDKKQVLLKTGYKRLYYISIFPERIPCSSPIL
jgi:hypothetical protein